MESLFVCPSHPCGEAKCPDTGTKAKKLGRMPKNWA